MSYQVIARKWRPQKFEQLVGQDHISKTLINALRNGRIPHALLFTGPRGTGKTSSARILAKSLRCPQVQDFIPCGECAECLDIAGGRSVNVMEIDGASNNGVDAIRELRDTVSYSPSVGKFKVYIIDEVHMLSTSAFNALLKTLEEPPEHVVFIMATTEVHKIPQTILSRCQRFDFRSIPTRQIADSLSHICSQENVTAEADALWIIARQGEGSMRDSQSLLDQVITFANGPLTRENVVQILGLTDRNLLLETLTALGQRDVHHVVQLIDKIRVSGIEPGLFAKELLESLRNLLLTKISPNPSDMLDLPESEIRFLQSIAVDLSEEDIQLLFDMTLKGAADIPRSSDPKIVLDMVLLRMAQAPKIVSIQDVLNFISQNDSSPQVTPSHQPPSARGPANSNSRGSSTHTSSLEPHSSNFTSSPLASKSASPVGSKNFSPNSSSELTSTPRTSGGPESAPRHKVDPMGRSSQELWLDFVIQLKTNDALLAAKVESISFLGEKNKVLELSVPPKFAFMKDQLNDPELKKKIQTAVESYFGSDYSFQILSDKNDKSSGHSAKEMVQKQQQAKAQAETQQVTDHPLFKSAQAALRGQIKTIKNQGE